mgnify:FL=1
MEKRTCLMRHSIELTFGEQIILAPTELRNRIMDAVNEKHGLKTEAQASVCSLKVDHFAPF